TPATGPHVTAWPLLGPIAGNFSPKSGRIVTIDHPVHHVCSTFQSYSEPTPPRRAAMMWANFFRMFWAAYLGIFGLLSITLLLEVYIACRHKDPMSLLTAMALSLMSVSLCVKANQCFRATRAHR